MTPKREGTGIRSLAYSKFRRGLQDPNTPTSERLYMTDIDDLEWRKDRGIVAFIETKHGKAGINTWQARVLRELSELTRRPSYLVAYQTDDPDEENIVSFEVTNLASNIAVSMTRAEYRSFLRLL